MVPLAICSFKNFRSSCNSGCDSLINFPGRVDGAPGLSSIAWSQSLDGGNSCDASSLNTLVNCWYCVGIPSTWASGCLGVPSRFVSVCPDGPITTRPMKY